MPLGELLLSMIMSAAYDVAKTTASQAVEDGQLDEVAKSLAAAYERACDRFFDHYGDQFGKPTSSFLARQANVDRALRSTFYSAKDLTPEDLDPQGFDDAPAATSEAVVFFVEVLHEEMRRNRALDQILEEKESLRLIRGVDRRLQEVHAALATPVHQAKDESAYEGVRVPEAFVTDVVRSTMLPVSLIPLKVYAAPCSYTEKEVRDLIDGTRARGLMLVYIVRGGVLYTFTNLYKQQNPFSAAMEGSPERLDAREWWTDPNRHRWYTELLSRALNKLTGWKGLNLDKAHDRYYFEPLRDRELEDDVDLEAVRDEQRFRSVRYRTLAGNPSSRKVAYRPSFKHSGEFRNYWEHWAVSLRFHQVGARSWCLTLRPGRRFTSDGYRQLASKGMGKRSTKQRSRMYNIDVLNEVHFWREYLSGSSPRILMRFGGQSLVIENEMLSGEVSWPGVPNDAKAITNERPEEDLFSQAHLDAALAASDTSEDAADNWDAGDEDWGDDWEDDDV